MQKGLILACLAAFAVGNAYAEDVVYKGKSTKKGDVCTMHAKVTSVTGPDNKPYSGVLFNASSPDGDRLDVHCANVVIKMKNDVAVFVVGMDETALKACHFEEHGKNAGMDKAANLMTTGKFTKDAG